jgi:hypothetical protein
MLNNDRTRKRTSKNNWQPTREEFQRMAIKHDTLLAFAKQHADDPTGILSSLYHDIIEKYCNLRGELRELRMHNAELRRMNMTLKMALEKSASAQVGVVNNNCEKW